MSEESDELKMLRWRSRRGMRELDQLFTRWLDEHWTQSPEPEREVFRRLLACEDDRLWRWFMGFEHAEDAELDALVQRIRNATA